MTSSVVDSRIWEITLCIKEDFSLEVSLLLQEKYCVFRWTSYPIMTYAQRSKLIAVIGDEDTCVGFLLGGVGELDRTRRPNFLVVDKNTAVADIEAAFRGFVARDDIAIILMNQYIAEMIRFVVDEHKKSIPAVLEIPSKEHPYDPSKDSIMHRARGLFNPEDFR